MADPAWLSPVAESKQLSCKPPPDISEYLSLNIEHGTQSLALHIAHNFTTRGRLPARSLTNADLTTSPPAPTTTSTNPRMPPRALFRQPLALRIIARPTYIHGTLLKCYSTGPGVPVDVLPRAATAGVTKPDIRTATAEVGERSNCIRVAGHAGTDVTNRSSTAPLGDGRVRPWC